MEAATTSPDAHHNPFEVLELRATATIRDVTRQKDKLLGMLELGLDRAKRYSSSIGDKERTADLVRTAAQELERPRSRLTWELWLQPSDDEVEADPDAATMRRALVLHYMLLRGIAHDEAFGVDELDELGLAWDDVLASDSLYTRIGDRVAELDLDLDESDVFDEFCAEIRTQMRTMFERGPVFDLDALTSEIASEVAHEFADRKVELLELACSRISKTARLVQRRQQWHGLVNEYAASITGRGDYFRRAAFQAVSAGLADLAVDLFNDNIDHPTALQMFQWLRDEAKNLGDDDLHALHAKNVTTVQSRIARDEAALHQAAYQGAQLSSSSSSDWGIGRVAMICVGIVLGLLRAGNSCSSYKSDSSYSTPRFQYQPPPDYYQNLQLLTPEATRIRERALRSLDEQPPPQDEPAP